MRISPSFAPYVRFFQYGRTKPYRSHRVSHVRFGADFFRECDKACKSGHIQTRHLSRALSDFLPQTCPESDIPVESRDSSRKRIHCAIVNKPVHIGRFVGSRAYPPEKDIQDTACKRARCFAPRYTSPFSFPWVPLPGPASSLAPLDHDHQEVDHSWHMIGLLPSYVYLSVLIVPK